MEEQALREKDYTKARRLAANGLEAWAQALARL